MAGSGGSSLMPILLLGGAGVAAYFLFFAPATSAAQASATPAGGTPPTPTPATPTSTYNTPDQIYQRLVQNLNTNLPGFSANPGQMAQTPYQWLYYLNQVTTVPSSLDFSKMFPSAVNSDGTPSANPNITLGQFWSSMSGWLAQNMGMSGIGLAGHITRGYAWPRR